MCFWIFFGGGFYTSDGMYHQNYFWDPYQFFSYFTVSIRLLSIVEEGEELRPQNIFTLNGSEREMLAGSSNSKLEHPLNTLVIPKPNIRYVVKYFEIYMSLNAAKG